MNADLQRALYRDFPGYFRDRRLPITQSCMGFGIECDDGWEPVIRRALAKMATAEVIHLIEFRGRQVKEKYGRLEMYTSVGGDGDLAAAGKALDQIINAAEEESLRTCEICGEPGALAVADHWYKTVCPAHLIRTGGRAARIVRHREQIADLPPAERAEAERLLAKMESVPEPAYEPYIYVERGRG